MRHLLARLVDFLAPRICPVCGNRMGIQEKTCCVQCYLDLPVTGFEQHPDDNSMAEMFYGIIPFEKAVAMYFYKKGNKTAKIVEQFKYHNRPQLAVEMGRICAQRLLPTGFFEQIDCLVPVPLARKRQRQRGYNQSMMLARGIAKETGLPVVGGVIVRKKFKQSQTRLSRMQRNENTANAFQLAGGTLLAGKHILLIDDVVTTGATLIACAEAALQAPDVRLNLLALAMTHD